VKPKVAHIDASRRFNKKFQGLACRRLSLKHTISSGIMSGCRQTGSWAKQMKALAQGRAFTASNRGRSSPATYDNAALLLAPPATTTFYRQSVFLTANMFQSSSKQGTNHNLPSFWSMALVASSGAILANQSMQDKERLWQPVSTEASAHPVSGTSVPMATSSSSSDKLDLGKLQADWDEYHLESLMYNDDDDDDEDEEEDEDDEEEENENDDTEDNKEAGDTTDTDGADDTEGGVTSVEDEVDPFDQGLDKELYPDDFSDLPEVEEDTTCSICLINREGPCRNPWRRFEKCIKVNPLKEGDDEKDGDGEGEGTTEGGGDSETSTAQVSRQCDHLFKPWFTCFSQHRITYSMITNKQVKEEMDFIEDTHGTEVIPSVLEAKLDTDDIQDMKWEPSLDKPYVQRYIKFPLHNPATGNTIRVAYARDDQGNVLGFDYFKSELDDGKTEGDMMFHMPGDTTSMTAYAYYTSPSPAPKDSPPPVTEGVTDEGEDSKDTTKTQKEDTSTDGELELEPLVVNEKVYFQHITFEIAPPKSAIESEEKTEGKEAGGPA
jgi:hypothetical protein